MIIVAGSIVVVAAAEREAYLATCAPVVSAARLAPGCLDFAIGADLVDDGRINVFERWADADALAAFRGDGPSDDQRAAIESADVAEFEVVG